MKFQLTEKDHLEKHHIYGLIQQYAWDNDGHQPEYIIVHPATYHKIIMLTNERNDDFTYSILHFNHIEKGPAVTLYGIAFIRSADIEEGFVIIT